MRPTFSLNLFGPCSGCEALKAAALEREAAHAREVAFLREQLVAAGAERRNLNDSVVALADKAALAVKNGYPGPRVVVPNADPDGKARGVVVTTVPRGRPANQDPSKMPGALPKTREEIEAGFKVATPPEAQSA